MPELPEVEVVVHQLRLHILGATVRKIWIGREDIIRQGLSTLGWYQGVTLTDIQRCGKCIVMTCLRGTQPRYLVAELGMTGLLVFHKQAIPDEKHTHMVLSLDGGRVPELRYWNARRFGRLYFLDQPGLDTFLRRRFGLDPFSASENQFVSLVKSCRGRMKALLLNQQKLAGIGNIYANEILYRARIHPHAQGARLSKARIQELYGAMREVLKEAIRYGGSTIRDFRAPDGTPGRFQERHQVYQKAGLPCPRGCKTLLRRLVTERSSFYCPTCQGRS